MPSRGSDYYIDARGEPVSEEPPSVMWQWEYGWMSPWRRWLVSFWVKWRRPLQVLFLGAAAFVLGGFLGSGPDSQLTVLELKERLRHSQNVVKAREGELQLVRLEMARLNTVMQNSARYHIPADLASQIYDIALSEGIDPDIAFRLVSLESDFTRTAVSSKGAVGLTQMMPSTARLLNPRLSRDDLFERETNLRLGFSYLRDLIRAYHGDLRLALLAYNRGPGIVDSIRKAGGDPANGYARAIMGAKANGR